MKVTDWLELRQTFPSELKVELRRVVNQDFDGKVYDVLRDLFKGINSLTQYIDMSVDLIKRACQDRQIPITVKGVPCNRGCGTCLGKYPYHYPYFTVKVGGRWKPVSTKHLDEFLLRLGLTEQQVRMFDRAVWGRHKLIALYHGLIITLNHMGMSKITLEVPELKPQKETAVSEG